MVGVLSTVGVLLVEDDAMVRGWVRMSLSATEFRLVGEAVDAAEALELVDRRIPDVLLVDYRLPDQVGTEFVRRLRRTGNAMPAVLMTANAERGFNELAREAGAEGTSMKTGRAEELLNALRLVAAGGTAYDARHPRRPAGLAALSPREREVITLVAGGATNGEIAQQLSVGSETVKTLLARTCTKLGVRKRAEAVAVAHELGIL
jgi:DNA-binding NarL/FixJ family response regulator